MLKIHETQPLKGGKGSTVVAALQRQGSILTASVVSTEFVHSLRERMGFLQLLKFPPTFQKHSLGG